MHNVDLRKTWVSWGLRGKEDFVCLALIAERTGYLMSLIPSSLLEFRVELPFNMNDKIRQYSYLESSTATPCNHHRILISCCWRTAIYSHCPLLSVTKNNLGRYMEYPDNFSGTSLVGSTGRQQCRSRPESSPDTSQNLHSRIQDLRGLKEN